MSINIDYSVERQKHKKQIRNYKIIISLTILLTTLLFFQSTFNINLTNKGYIASVSLVNEILEDQNRENKFQKILEDSNIKALIVNINSPGGSFVGSEKIYNILRKITKKKPVVVVMGTIATSGAYLVSLAADYILACNGTITGSIGVIYPTFEITSLAEKIGIKFYNLKSGKLKAMPNIMEKINPTVTKVTMESIQDIHNYFLEIIVSRRNLPLQYVKKLSDGRIYTGRQALKLGIIDAIGDQEDAVDWLKNTKKLDAKLEVKEIKLNFENTYPILSKLVESLYNNTFKYSKVLLSTL